MSTREIAERIEHFNRGMTPLARARLIDAIATSLTDERKRAARIIREHRESDKCEGSCWAIITQAILRDSTEEEGS